jgi:hypothetical protein
MAKKDDNQVLRNLTTDRKSVKKKIYITVIKELSESDEC